MQQKCIIYTISLINTKIHMKCHNLNEIVKTCNHISIVLMYLVTGFVLKEFYHIKTSCLVINFHIVYMSPVFGVFDQ